MKNIKEHQETYNRLFAAIRREGVTYGQNDKRTAKLIREAVAAGFPVDYHNQYCQMLLHCAARRNKPECCRALLELGAEPNSRDRFGQTPLYLAFLWENIDCAKLLIDAGADWNIPANNDGMLPLDRLKIFKNKAARDELQEYITRRLSQVHSVLAEEEEPAYVQEL